MFRKHLSKTVCMIALLFACSMSAACGNDTTVATQQDTVQAETTAADTSKQGETEVLETETGKETDVTKEEDVVAKEEEAMTEPRVYFTSKSGFYEKGFSLELVCPVEGAAIYYTTDGSVPTDKSNKYEGPIALEDVSGKAVLADRTDFASDTKYVPINDVTKGNVIRAIAYFADGTSSIVTDGTYFIGLDREKLYGDAPIVSLITDNENLFDEEKGIFVLGKTYEEWLAEDPKNAEEPPYRVKGNFSNKGRDWEKPVAFEFIPASGNNVSADMGLRMKGASTRTYLQKSMRLIAREEYGTKSIKTSLIPDNMRSDGTGEVEKYRSFVLRNGGNDNGFAKLRDPLLQSLISDRSMETQQSVPCVVFVNGEYWGLYAITEDYTDHYFEENYGVDNKNVVVVKGGEIEEGEEADIALYQELYDFITGNDMKNPENYAKAQEMLDIPGFIEYCAFQFYVYNHDAFDQDNNWSIWRTREADQATAVSDGKWRIALFDTEFSSGVYSGGQEFGENNLSSYFDKEMDADVEYKTDYPLIHIFRSLYENKEFQQDLINTACDVRNYDFEKNRAFAALDAMAEQYKPLAGDSFFRYGPDWVVMFGDPNDYYADKLKELKTYLGGRYTAYLGILQKQFDLSAAQNVSISTDPAMGTVQVNYTTLDFDQIGSDTFTGAYFPEYPIKLKAIAKEGYQFMGWEVEGVTLSDESSDTVTATIAEKASIKAVFRKNR